MDTFVLRWTKDSLPFWQGVDDGEKIEINAVADVINENAMLKREQVRIRDHLRTFTSGLITIEQMYIVADALLTKENNDG